MSKVFVSVEALFDKNVGILPRCIIWKDGERYEIDRVLDVRRAASLKAGGIGVRYTVRILGQERYLFLDDNKWFVEGKN